MKTVPCWRWKSGVPDRMSKPFPLLVLAVLVFSGECVEAGGISGTVRDPGGTVLEGIGVTAWRKGSILWTGTRTRTSVAGAYAFPNLAAGTYRVEFADDQDDNFAHETYDNSPRLSDGKDVPVTSGSSTNINATLEPARVISGKVLAPDGITGLGNISVWAYLDEGTLGWKQKGGFGTTDANGNYVIRGLAACPYRVKAMDMDVGDYLSKVYPAANDLAAGADIDLAAVTTVSGVNFTLSTAGKISGRVLTTNGTPVVDGNVDVRVWNGTGWDYADASDGFLDHDGRFTVGGLSSGVYRVEFQIWNNEDVLDEFYDNALEIESGRDVTVVEGSTVGNIDAVLDTPSWPPVIIRLSSKSSGKEIAYTEKAGQTYTLQTSSDLDEDWVDVETNPGFGTGVGTFWQYSTPGEPRRFWRIKY
ncbi:MAG: carboxypeptidase-like regulatory domain-containing protein [Kiritimatiellia bacterium]